MKFRVWSDRAAGKRIEERSKTYCEKNNVTSVVKQMNRHRQQTITIAIEIEKIK